jgi:hypothetical protein
MTNPDTARMINDQIAVEFEKLNDFMTFDSEKPAIMDRIERLKAMLDESEEQETVTTLPTLTEIANGLRAFRRR